MLSCDGTWQFCCDIVTINSCFLNRNQRVKYSAVHPRTPDPYEESSKRQFDGRFKAWRRELHKWDNMENIAKVEIQVQVVAPRSSSSADGDDCSTQMDGVVETSSGTNTRPMVVMAPLCTPNSKVLGRPNSKKEKSISNRSIDGADSNHSNGAAKNHMNSRENVELGEIVGEADVFAYPPNKKRKSDPLEPAVTETETLVNVEEQVGEFGADLPSEPYDEDEDVL